MASTAGRLLVASPLIGDPNFERSVILMLEHDETSAEVLVSTPACAVQAMSWGGKAFSMQYHVEIDETTVPMWGAIPEYAVALEKAAGAGALERFKAHADERMADMKADSERLYENFMAATGLRA